MEYIIIYDSGKQYRYLYDPDNLPDWFNGEYEKLLDSNKKV